MKRQPDPPAQRDTRTPHQKLDDEMFATALGGMLREANDEERPSLGDIETVDAILRKMGHDLLTPPKEVDPGRRTREVLERTADTLTGRGNDVIAVDGWNTPDREGRTGLVEFLRQHFGIGAGEPREVVAAALGILAVELLDLANSRQKGEDVDDATDGLFQTYSWVFVGIDPSTVE